MTDTTPVPPMSETPVPKIDVRALNPLLDGLAKLTDAEATITRLENDNSNLRTEVERLTNELAFERRDRAMADAAAESLRATVAEQGAALAELERYIKVMRNSGDKTASFWANELNSALASAQSREQEKAT